MGTNDYPFKLYSEKLPNTVKLDLVLFRSLFEDMRIDAPQMARPGTHLLVRYNISYYVIIFLEDSFSENSGKKDNSPLLDRINSNGLYMNKNDIAVIKKALEKCKAGFITDYFLHEFCFLVSYYSWLIPKEKEIDYKKELEEFSPRYPEPDNARSSPEHHIQLYVQVKKLIDHKKTNPTLRKYLRDWNNWKALNEGMQYYTARKKELKTTASENVNEMLLKKRVYDTFYCYLKFAVCPTISTIYSKAGFIKKYSAIYKLTTNEAINEILNKKLYVDSERKLFEIVGSMFQLLGLYNSFDPAEYIKEYQKELTRKYNQKGPWYSIGPDGTKKVFRTAEEVKKGLADLRLDFNMKSKVGSLRRYINKQNAKQPETRLAK